MAKPPFTIEDIKEKYVVLDELRQGKDSPFQILNTAVIGAAFSRSGYRVDTGGFLKDVENVPYEVLGDFHKKFYGPNNAHIVVVGGIDPNKVLKHVHENFNDLPAREIEESNREQLIQDGAKTVMVNTDLPVAMICLAYHNIEGMGRDSLVCDVISQIITYPGLGILHALKELGVMPSNAVLNNRLKDRHLFQIVGSLLSPNPRVMTMVSTFLNQYTESLKVNAIPDKVLNIVKKSLLNECKNVRSNGVQTLGLAATEAVALGSLNDLFEKASVIKSITPNDVMRVAKYLFRPERSVFGILKMRGEANIPRPLKNSENYIMLPAPAEEGWKNVTSKINNMKNYSDIGAPTIEKFSCAYGVLCRVSTKKNNKIHVLMSMRADNTNDAVAKVAVRLINEGLPKSRPNMENLTMSEAKDMHGSVDLENFQTFMVMNNVDFGMAVEKSKLHLSLGLDADCDFKEVMGKLATAIQNIKATKEAVAMKSTLTIGSYKGLEHDPHFQTKHIISSSLFDKEDINFSESPADLVKKVNAVTLDDIEHFKSVLKSKNSPMAVTVVVPNNVENKMLDTGFKTFYESFNGKNAENDTFTSSLPFDKHTSNTLSPERINNLKSMEENIQEIKIAGRKDGVAAIGVRLNGLDRNNQDWTAIRIALQTLGGGMNSRLNNKLRIKEAISYGVYSRLRYGNFGSDSLAHLFGTFSSENLKRGANEMYEIYNNFVENGITADEFNLKKKNFLYSLKVTTDPLPALAKLNHSTLLNGCEIDLNEIQARAAKLTRQECNNAIKKYFNGAPLVRVVAGSL